MSDTSDYNVLTNNKEEANNDRTKKDRASKDLDSNDTKLKFQYEDEDRIDDTHLADQNGLGEVINL